MPTATRRLFLRQAAAVSLGFLGLGRASRGGQLTIDPIGWGPLIPDPAGLLDLPAGLTYTLFSPAGSTMDDGLVVPGRHDGMAAFAGADGTTILMRNHEVAAIHPNAHGPWGDGFEHWDPALRGHVYDTGRSLFGHDMPCRGGVTRVVWNHKARAIEQQHLALAGTEYNCAGGPTPRRTWISCEEYVTGPEHGPPWTKTHGWCFEVPADGARLCRPEPITTMGRFRHEAVATDPRTGIVYLTEDRSDGAFYRWLPVHPDRLLEGGRLQALALDGCASADTRDWDSHMPLTRGVPSPVHWIDLESVDGDDDALRYQAFKKGAARFARAEGCWMGDKEIWFACTTGGRTKHGQLLRYRPSPFEATGGEVAHPGTVELFLQPDDPNVIENADNITVAPWGDLIVCEDGDAPEHLLGVTPQGSVYRIARNSGSKTEFAGACFSPDGSTLFVNLQSPGVTAAIHLPEGSRPNRS